MKVAMKRQNIASVAYFSGPPCISLHVLYSVCLSVCLSLCLVLSLRRRSCFAISRSRRAKNVNYRAPIWSRGHQNSSPVLSKQGAIVAVKVATVRDTSILLNLERCSLANATQRSVAVVRPFVSLSVCHTLVLWLNESS